MEPELIVWGGTVVSHEKSRRADIAVFNGKFSLIAPAGSLKNKEAVRKIDARGLLVLPGIIDPHVHFQLPVGDIVTSDDFESGSRAALCGGVTTVIDYTTQAPGVPLAEAIQNRLGEALGKMHCDYSLHCVIPSWKKLENPGRQMERLVKSGIPTFKMFMIYAARGLQADDADLFEALETSGKCGAMVCVHAEADLLINLLISRTSGKKFPGAMGHAASRPGFTEWEAVQRAVALAEVTGGRLYVVHVSAARSGEIIGEARRRGINVRGETCPQYLVLDDRVLADKKIGHLYATCPQLKKRKDNAGLWRELEKGSLSVIGTDHCSFSKAQKARWNGDFTKIPYGMPGVETSLPAVYTHGVLKGRITINKLVEAMSYNQAKLTGLFPRKGIIRKGADADLAIINPGQSRVVDYRELRMNCDWSPYQGWKMEGFPEYTILRGKVLVAGGELEGKKPGGIFLKRKPWGKI